MVLFCISYRVVCKILEISETALFYYQYTFSENFKLKEILGDFDVIFNFSHAQLNSYDSSELVGLSLLKNQVLLLLSESNLSKQKVRAY